MNRKQKKKDFELKDLLNVDNLCISMDSTWKAVFDTSILFVIGYSCATSVFNVSFDVQVKGFLIILDDIVTFFFALDLIFNCFMEYKDEETFVKVRDIKKITIRYAKSGWMLVDFLATFPFNLFFEDAVYTRMIRLSRLSKMVAILDVSRVQRMIKSYFDKSTRADRIQTQFILIYNYKIMRLIIIVFMITYLIGSFWWLIVKNVNTTEDIDAGNTFIRNWALDEIYWFPDPHSLC